MKFKKLSLALAGLLCFGCFTACAGGDPGKKPGESQNPATIDLTEEISRPLRDASEVNWLDYNEDFISYPFFSDLQDEVNSEELKELFRIVRGTKIEFPVIMAAYYGLRRSEIVGLKWSAVDFNYKTIQIRHTVTNSVTDGKYVLIKKNRTKTQKSLRTLPLFANVEQMLLQMKEEQERYKELFGNSYDYTDSEYIYVHENGKLIDPGYITQHFGIVLRNNGLRKIRFHDLRHSCATLLRHNGARMEDIQRWLGHSTIGTTEKIYAHFEEEEHLISAGRIAKALQPDSDNPDERSLPAPKGKSDFEM